MTKIIKLTYTYYETGFELIIITFYRIIYKLKKLTKFDFSKCSTIRKYIDMIWYSYDRFIIYLTDEIDEPEKTAGPSGVVPSM